jgi:D-3-phosphoglycerate dehydrogenase / 2-oxoglutarate reductase
MHTVVIGDHFISAEEIRAAIADELGEDFGPVSTATWSGADREEQHAAQQIMEKEGPDAVPLPSEVVEAVGEAEALAVHFAPVPDAVLEAAPSLRAVVVARAGTENVDVEAATRRGIQVVNLQGRNANAVAEQTIGHILAVTRDIARADAAIRAGRWPEDPRDGIFELAGRTVGLIGFGNVGRTVARRLAGFEVRLLVHDPYVDRVVIEGHGGEVADGLDAVFEQADVVSLHARLSEETNRFIGERQFSLMRPTAYFVNTARSRMVDYDALYAALSEGRIAGAALDVHDDEPLPAESPWRRLPNVSLTPHQAGITPQTFENTTRMVAEAIGAIDRGADVPNVVNADALARAPR